MRHNSILLWKNPGKQTLNLIYFAQFSNVVVLAQHERLLINFVLFHFIGTSIDKRGAFENPNLSRAPAAESQQFFGRGTI